jgi:hypothetical protein
MMVTTRLVAEWQSVLSQDTDTSSVDAGSVLCQGTGAHDAEDSTLFPRRGNFRVFPHF